MLKILTNTLWNNYFLQFMLLSTRLIFDVIPLIVLPLVQQLALHIYLVVTPVLVSMTVIFAIHVVWMPSILILVIQIMMRLYIILYVVMKDIMLLLWNRKSMTYISVMPKCCIYMLSRIWISVMPIPNISVVLGILLMWLQKIFVITGLLLIKLDLVLFVAASAMIWWLWWLED